MASKWGARHGLPGYDKFRTGLTYSQVFEMLKDNHEDPKLWKYKRRRGVLGSWHQMKLELYHRAVEAGLIGGAMKSSCYSRTVGSTLAGMELTNGKSLADTSRPAGVGQAAMCDNLGMAAFVLAALVVPSVVSGRYDQLGPRAAPYAGQADRNHALGSRWPAMVRGELPGAVDEGAGIRDVSGLPRGRRTGDDVVLDKHEVTL